MILVTGGDQLALSRLPPAEGIAANEALASVAPAAPNSASLWAGYVATWTAWNHVRTAASLAAAASFSIALSY